MIKLNIKTEGIKEMIKAFTDLENVDLPRVVYDILDSGARMALTTMKQNTPVDTGNLQNSVGILERTASSAFVGPDLGKAHYAYYVEMGHHTRSGGWVPGQFFVERTAVQVGPNIEKIAMSAVARAVNKF